MANEVELKLKIDKSNATKALADVDKQAKKVGTTFKDVGSAAKVGFAALAVGVAVVGAAVSRLISTYKVQEQAEIRTRQTLEATGYAAGVSAKQIFEMSSALQDVTTYGDETIIAGANLLLTFKNIGSDIFPRATEAMLDMATAMGTDTKSAAIQLGKALNDPLLGISALNRVGIQFTKQQKDQIAAMQSAGDIAGAQGIILAELEGQMGGVARAAADGTGVFEQMSNVVGDLWEVVGQKLVPVFAPLAKGIKAVTLELIQFLNAGDNGKSEQINESLERTRATFDRLQKKVEYFKSQDSLGWLDTRTLDNYSARLVTLQKEIENLEKEKAKYAKIEYQNSEESLTKQKNKNLALKAEENAAKLALEQQYQQSLVEYETARTEQTLDKNATDLENLQFQLAMEQEAKVAAQAEELASKGEHEKALQLLSENTKKLNIKNMEEEKKLNIKNMEKEKKRREQLLQFQMNTLDRLAAMTASSNMTLKAIGKAASLVRIAMATRTGAIEAYAALSGVPGVGPGLGIAAAAALTAYGAEQARGVMAMADGGMVRGGMANRDSVPAMLMPGELVVPKTNFEEVINAVRNERGIGSASTTTEVIIGFKDNAIEIIEEKILERRRLGLTAV